MVRGLLLALLLIEGVAWADDPLARARRAVSASDYVGARPQLAAALDAGGHAPEELAEIYRLSGIVHAALGDVKAATAAFTRLLALSPKAKLPAGTSPKIKRPFDAAVRYFKTHAALEVRIETTPSPPAIALVQVSDPLDMLARARVVFAVDGGAEDTKDVVASERTEVGLPAGRRIEARVWMLDVHGNHLIEIGSKEAPVVILGEPPPAPVVVAPAPAVVAKPVVHAPRRPLYLRWWPYATAAGVLGAGAGYFAWSARSDIQELDRLNADSVNHQFGEARTVEDRARRNLLVMNIGLGAAGACAIAAGILYVTKPRRSETRITAVPVAGGGAVVLGGTF